MTVFLASGNAHKAQEFAGLAAADRLPLEIRPASEAGGMPPVDEDSGTFEGNARKKAGALLRIVPRGCWTLADDSGLCVDALGGAPGVDSAVYAGRHGDSAANLARLVRELKGVPEAMRAAHFICVLVLAGPEGAGATFTGRCDGRLVNAPRGTGGFGYDPLFVPDGHDRTFAELGGAVKASISHRARAWAQLAAWVRTR